MLQANPPKDKAIAILFCLFFGSFGAHNFYTGFNGMGAAQLVLLLVGGVVFRSSHRNTLVDCVGHLGVC